MRSGVAIAGLAVVLLLGAVAWLLLRPGDMGTHPDLTTSPTAAPAPAPRAPPPVPPPAPSLPEYAPREKVKGKLQTAGSDTMINAMTLWTEGVRKFHPAISIEIEGKGSSTAPPALVAGTAQFGPMSREMKAKEIDYFRKKFGYEPTGLATSLDMLAIYVHRDNPIKGLTLPQVDAIFSKERKGGHPADIRTWGDLGLTGEWAEQPIRLYGRNSASGTYGYFKEHALRLGTFKDTVMEQPGSSLVVQGVAKDRFGIGYSGIGYKTRDVRAIPLAAKPGQPFVEPAIENAHSRTYPLSRFLWLYVNYDKRTPLDPARREFLLYVFSRQGQEDVVKSGYDPLTPAMAREQLAKVGL